LIRMNGSAVIENVKARRIFDSRGNEAIEVDVITSKSMGRSSAPSGASKGRWEVKSYPNGGVVQAIKIVEEIAAPRLTGVSVDDPKSVDAKLHQIDESRDFAKLGGNTAYAISLASAMAGAASKGIHLFKHLAETLTFALPYPLGNVIGGGLHAKGERTDIQEFLVLPVRSRNFAEAAAANIKVHREVAGLIEDKGVKLAGRGDEGAWVVPLETEQVLEILSKACGRIADETGVKLGIGLDVASSTMWNEKDGVYVYQRDKKRLDTGDQIDFMVNLVRDYKLVYVEDPFDDESFQSFSELTAKVRGILICGDDLFATNIERLKKGIKEKAGNAIIIKPNQVGTITDAFVTAKLAKEANYACVVSHRSGESCGHELAHVALALSAPIIKLGVLGGERIAKINELIRIEEVLGGQARMADTRI
jgi:enolase